MTNDPFARRMLAALTAQNVTPLRMRATTEPELDDSELIIRVVGDDQWGVSCGPYGYSFTRFHTDHVNPGESYAEFLVESMNPVVVAKAVKEFLEN